MKKKPVVLVIGGRPTDHELLTIQVSPLATLVFAEIEHAIQKFTQKPSASIIMVFDQVTLSVKLEDAKVPVSKLWARRRAELRARGQEDDAISTVHKLRERFSGTMIAASDDRLYGQAMLRAGCDYGWDSASATMLVLEALNPQAPVPVAGGAK